MPICPFQAAEAPALISALPSPLQAYFLIHKTGEEDRTHDPQRAVCRPDLSAAGSQAKYRN